MKPASDSMAGRRRRRFQAHGQALDHVGAVAGDGRLRHGLHRAEARSGVVLGDHDDERRDDQSDQAAKEQGLGVDDRPGVGGDRGRDKGVDRPPDGPDRQDAGHDQALIEGPHDVLRPPQAHREGAEDRGHDADCADDQRQKHQVHRAGAEEDGGQHHGGHCGHGVGLEQVGRHARAVPDIVADIVRNRGGVAGVILRDAGLDLAHHVSAHVGALGEDPAAQTGEDGNQRGAEAQGDQGVDDVPVIMRQAHGAGQDVEIARNAQQREARHQHAGDGPGTKGHGQALRQTLGGRLRCPHIRADRDQHADKAGDA
jgi:hypothetical protein